MSGFSDVDASGRAPELLGYLDHAHAGLTAAKARLRAGLDVRPGERALDLGCGAGHELVALEHAGAHAVGVDPSAAMVGASARRLVDGGLPVRLAQADGARLPFADATFDVCRIERVLQHVEDPTVVVREAVRVLRPGGRLGVLEPDWASFTLASRDPDAARAVADAVGGTVRNREVGRHLRRLLGEAGLVVTGVEVELVVYADLDELARMLSLGQAADRAVEAGSIDRARADALLAEQVDLSARGLFHATLNRSVLAWATRGAAAGHRKPTADSPPVG